MASEVATVMLTVVGIAVIVVGVMILMQRPRVVEKEVVVRRPWYPYSRYPLNPMIF